MSVVDPQMPIIEILYPDGRSARPERRLAPCFRPYSAFDGCVPGRSIVRSDRRRRRRLAATQPIGVKVDLLR